MATANTFKLRQASSILIMLPHVMTKPSSSGPILIQNCVALVKLVLVKASRDLLVPDLAQRGNFGGLMFKVTAFLYST